MGDSQPITTNMGDISSIFTLGLGIRFFSMVKAYSIAKGGKKGLGNKKNTYKVQRP
jgi:hypothetical protein